MGPRGSPSSPNFSCYNRRSCRFPYPNAPSSCVPPTPLCHLLDGNDRGRWEWRRRRRRSSALLSFPLHLSSLEQSPLLWPFFELYCPSKPSRFRHYLQVLLGDSVLPCVSGSKISFSLEFRFPPGSVFAFLSLFVCLFVCCSFICFM